MNLMEQWIHDVKLGINQVKGWNKRQWKMAAPVMGFFLFVMIWFLAYNLYTARTASERPLYETQMGTKLMTPALPVLVLPNEVSTGAAAFIADDDYRYFSNALKVLGNNLADKNSGINDKIILDAIEELEFNLPENIGKGQLIDSSLQDISNNTANGYITVAYGSGEGRQTVTWIAVFGRPDGASSGADWKLDSLTRDIKTDET